MSPIIAVVPPKMATGPKLEKTKKKMLVQLILVVLDESKL